MREGSRESGTTLLAAKAPHRASSDSPVNRAPQHGQTNKRKGQVIPPTTQTHRAAVSPWQGDTDPGHHRTRSG